MKLKVEGEADGQPKAASTHYRSIARFLFVQASARIVEVRVLMLGFCRQLHSRSCTKGMTLIQCVDHTLSSAVRQLRSLPCTNLKT